MCTSFTRLFAGFVFLFSALSFITLSPTHGHAQDRIPAEVTRQKFSTPASDPLRVTSVVGFGTLFGTIAGSIPLLSGMGIQVHDIVKYRDPNRHPFLIEGTLIASALVYPAGVAAGAILGGYLTDSQSGYWEPFVGAYAGALIADITAYFLQEDYPIFSAVLVILLPIITTTIAAETSHHWRKTSQKSDDRAFMPLNLQFSF